VFLFLGAAANVCTGVLLWLVLRDLGTPIEALRAAGVVGVSHLSGSISLLPGGLGGFELAMLAQLAAFGVPATAALVALAVVRITSFWAGVVIGLPLLWIEMNRGASPVRPRGRG
jgi:phosphatidylglycerol lysyltransferase